MFFYSFRSYKYAPKATNFSNLSMALTILGLICGPLFVVAYFSNQNTHKLVFLLAGIGLLALAAVSYFWLYRVVVPNYAQKEHPANLKTNISVALQFVRDNPEQYDYICSINPVFAERYLMEECGSGVMQPKRRRSQT